MNVKHEDQQPALSRRKKITFSLILFLFPLLSALLVAEIYIRATQDNVDLWALTGRKIGANPMEPWAFIDAFSAYRGKPGQYRGTKLINSHGFMSTPEITLEKPDGTVRLVFLGGSSTAGTGGTGKNLNDEDTWPWLVVEQLRQEFPEQKFDFINGALGGYTSFEGYGRLWSRLRFYSPDIIVIYHGWNDMIYFGDAAKAATWRTLPDGSWTFDKMAEPLTVYEPLAVDYLIRPFQSLSYLRLFFTEPVDGEVGIDQELAGDFDHDALEVWRTNLQLYRAAADIMGAELFVAKQATLIVPNLPMEERARIRYGHHGFDHDAHVAAFAGVYRVIDEEIAPDHVIDATRLSGRSEYFFDHIHPTVSGAQQIAAEVSAVLAQFLRDQ